MLTVRRPVAHSTFRVGDTIALEADAQDDQDGALGGAAITWDVVLHHDEHVHPLSRRNGRKSVFDTLAAHGADSYYEVTVTATDTGGVSTTKTVTLRPRVGSLEARFRPARRVASDGTAGN